MNKIPEENKEKQNVQERNVVTHKTIYMIGDSTMADYDEKKEYPRSGWGQQLGKYFKPGRVTVVNKALPGWTTQLFLDTGRVDEVFRAMKPGDYLIMQFGHNDQKSNEEGYVPMERYKENLAFFAGKTRSLGGVPIICSSITRRLYHADGSFRETGDLGIYQHSLKEYGEAAKAVASELNIPFVDLFAYSVGQITSMTVEQSDKLYMVLKPKDPYWLAKNPEFLQSNYYETGENPEDPYSHNPDNAHATVEGADKWAAYAIACLKEMVPELADDITE